VTSSGQFFLNQPSLVLLTASRQTRPAILWNEKCLQKVPLRQGARAPQNGRILPSAVAKHKRTQGQGTRRCYRPTI